MFGRAHDAVSQRAAILAAHVAGHDHHEIGARGCAPAGRLGSGTPGRAVPGLAAGNRRPDHQTETCQKRHAPRCRHPSLPSLPPIAPRGKRGQAPFVRSTGHHAQRGQAVPAKGACPLSPNPDHTAPAGSRQGETGVAGWDIIPHGAGKGDRHLLCKAPGTTRSVVRPGTARSVVWQKVPVPFPRRLRRENPACLKPRAYPQVTRRSTCS